MSNITWRNITRRRWAAAGLCEDSYNTWRTYPTPQAAYEACTSPSDLLRVVFGVLPRKEAVAVLCSAIRPIIAPHAPTASLDALTVIERWSVGDATDEELAAAEARVAAREAARAAARAAAEAARAAAWAAKAEARAAARAAWAAAEAEAWAAKAAAWAAAWAAWAAAEAAAAEAAAADNQMCATIRERAPWARIEAAIVAKWQIEVAS